MAEEKPAPADDGDGPDKEDDQDILAEAKTKFQQCEDAESFNRQTALDDIQFALLSQQWDARDVAQRQREGRPCLTINKLDPLIRQVVNDARQNKPSIKVHPADSGADPETAEVYDGLIRNIEYTSSADIAYDTATEQAVSGGFGYFRVGLEYAFDDSFDLDIRIERISNQFSVYGDPMSTSADSSDWNVAFVVDRMTVEDFKRVYGKSEAIDWDSGAYGAEGLSDGTWFTGDLVQVAEYWTREEYDKEIALLSDGSVIDAKTVKDDVVAVMMAAEGLTVKQVRTARCHKVMQRIMTGNDIISTREWPGKFIPIVPVYGREINVRGKRYLKSLIHDAKDSQRMFNYWRTASTELVALAPKAPFIGPKGAFKTDADKWATANRISHAYIEFDGPEAPERQAFAGPPAAALQEALNASDDIKSSTGIYDASLGAKSNETSGRAIMARQREGDVSTFHFQDNMVRAIRHAGRILIDLIPKVYTKDRMIRILGEDQQPRTLALGQPAPVMKNGKPVMVPPQQNGPQQPAQPPQMGNGQPPEDNTASEIMMKVFDLGVGKYDLTVTTGPSFTTRREEAAQQMTEMVRAFPMAAPVIIPKLAKNLDWPGADDIAEELQAIAPKPDAIPPPVKEALQKGQQALQENKQTIDQLTMKLQAAESDKSVQMMQAQTDQFEAETKRMTAEFDMRAKMIELNRPQPVPTSTQQ